MNAQELADWLRDAGDYDVTDIGAQRRLFMRGSDPMVAIVRADGETTQVKKATLEEAEELLNK